MGERIWKPAIIREREPVRMGKNKGKVVVAMSGGVDSSVAACLLHEQGYEVVGLFMRVGAKEEVGAEAAAPATGRAHQGCCSAADAADARFVAGHLGVPFYALNFERAFDAIIDSFAEEYARGRTPNPCVVCNSHLKFGRLFDYADAVGADYIATGHYARIERRDGENHLLRGADHRKDQSYVLFGIERDALDRMLLPVGALQKDEVRAAARRFDLPIHDKPDSVDICFVPDRDYARVVRERQPAAFVAGDVVDSEGNVVGQHDGLPHFTVGQRRGLGIAAGVPIYVTRLNVLDNTIEVGQRDALLHRRLRAERVHMLTDPLVNEFGADVQIRYHHQAARARVTLDADQSAIITFDDPQPAITPGQAAVFYDGDRVLGGGWIDGPLDD